MGTPNPLPSADGESPSAPALEHVADSCSQADLHPYDTVDFGHAPCTGTCVETIALEGNGILVGVSGVEPRVCGCFVHSRYSPNKQPTRRRSGTLEKRRALKSRKSDLIDKFGRS